MCQRRKRITLHAKNTYSCRGEGALAKHVTERLKELRKRADYSMAALARAMEKAGGSSYQRYEDPEAMYKGYLPFDIVVDRS